MGQNEFETEEIIQKSVATLKSIKICIWVMALVTRWSTRIVQV